MNMKKFLLIISILIAISLALVAVNEVKFNKEVKTMTIEELLEKGLWQNYPLGKKTVMNVDGTEFVIEVYFLTDVN